MRSEREVAFSVLWSVGETADEAFAHWKTPLIDPNQIGLVLL